MKATSSREARGILEAATERSRSPPPSVLGENHLPRRFSGLQAPVSLGPPAFFPVGNAAGRFEPLTRGLESVTPHLLFVGISDPRHVFDALSALPNHTECVTCVLNDLNAETCARNALILQLLSSSFPFPQRIISIFALWWLHELPARSLPLLSQAAKGVQASCCSKTKAMIDLWLSSWNEASPESGSELADVAKEVESSKAWPKDMQESMAWLLEGGFVENISLQHQAARLQYNLHASKAAPIGWEHAGDGVLLWPNLEEEFDPDQGPPSRAEYIAALAKLLPRFLEAIMALQDWFPHKAARLQQGFLALAVCCCSSAAP